MKIPGSEITMSNAPEVMNLGAKAVSEGDGVFDFEGISHADSSARRGAAAMEAALRERPCRL